MLKLTGLAIWMSEETIVLHLCQELMRQDQSPGWLRASARAIILALEALDPRFIKELRIDCRGSAPRTRHRISSVSLLAVDCAKV